MDGRVPDRGVVVCLIGVAMCPTYIIAVCLAWGVAVCAFGWVVVCLTGGMAVCLMAVCPFGDGCGPDSVTGG